MAESKILLSEEELTRTLNAMLHEYEDTEGCEFRGVRWHECDTEGANWESTFLGGHVSQYVIEVAKQVEARARALYNLTE